MHEQGHKKFLRPSSTTIQINSDKGVFTKTASHHDKGTYGNECGAGERGHNG